ncbi:hypothetical protein COS52_04790 [Candidatus Roizmanbacteria bacterium CG03_land_8_20_14_0_80_39_12]|uniref:Uncharacterized protein n=1 Tax=Candidatus Roizmanbacteria bacterium CG03_land_8_20_14_0_80_39_12 TaxID=1974847 RepID=A0A2M7BRC1_9BACT|nr:MAG: hypothetical protein COS52_04790 [Candidatus Roizmanbacteria bacterium CG03_land_8_20_14_0_80_39_12]
MNIFHTELKDRWNSFSIFEQMANIGAEVGRMNSWRKKGNKQMSLNAFYRALELVDFSVADSKNKRSLKEILYVRELLVDDYLGENIYHSSDVEWEKYFLPFNLAARSY